MRRSAKRSRNAAGKSLGDMCATQKARATVGSSVRGGASASMVSSSVAVLPILFFSGLVARNFWKMAPPLAAVPSELLAFEFEAGSPPPPPELATKEGKNRGGPLNPARLSATLGETCVACRGQRLELHERQRIQRDSRPRSRIGSIRTSREDQGYRLRAQQAKA